MAFLNNEDKEKGWELSYPSSSRLKKICGGCNETIWPNVEAGIDTKTGKLWHKWCCLSEIKKREKDENKTT